MDKKKGGFQVKNFLAVLTVLAIELRGFAFDDEVQIVAAQYSFNDWKGQTAQVYTGLVSQAWCLPTLPVQTNSQIKVRDMGDDLPAARGLVLHKNQWDNVLTVYTYVCTNVVQAQEGFMYKFSGRTSTAVLPVITNSIGDRCYYRAVSNGWRCAYFHRNNVFVGVECDPGFVSAETIARAIDNDILLFMRTNSPAGGNE